MDIENGSRVIVEFSGKQRMNCRYVGQLLDEFLLLQVPMSPGIRSRLTPGTYLQFRFLRDGKIIGFGAEIISYQATPASLAFISYPNDFSEYNLRHEGRVTCMFPATLSLMGKPHSGRIVDISPHGCRFVFDEFPMPKTEEKMPVSGYFRTMEGGTNYDFKGDIMTRSTQGANKGLGIKFSGDIRLPDGITEHFQELAEMRDEAKKMAEGCK